MCQKKEQVKLCRINVKKTFPIDMMDFSPEERAEYEKILKEESSPTGINIYDYYNLNEEDL